MVGYSIIRAEHVALSTIENTKAVRREDIARSVAGLQNNQTVSSGQGAFALQPQQVVLGDTATRAVPIQENANPTARDIIPTWLAPIFATIGLSLGIIALWLYFVRL